MKIISLILAFLLLAVQPAQAVVMVGFGQSAAGPEILRANGGGTANWTTYDAAAYPAHITYVGDNTDTTYLYTTGALISERHGLPDTASEGIVSIDFCVRARSNNGTAQMRIYAYHTNWGYGSYFSPANGTWTEYCHNTTVDPATSSAWTLSGFNATDVGANSDGTAGDGQIDISEMYVKINR